MLTSQSRRSRVRARHTISAARPATSGSPPTPAGTRAAARRRNRVLTTISALAARLLLALASRVAVQTTPWHSRSDRRRGRSPPFEPSSRARTTSSSAGNGRSHRSRRRVGLNDDSARSCESPPCMLPPLTAPGPPSGATCRGTWEADVWARARGRGLRVPQHADADGGAVRQRAGRIGSGAPRLRPVVAGRTLKVARHYGATAMSYQITPLAKVALHTVWNVDDGSGVLWPRVEYSVATNFDVAAGI